LGEAILYGVVASAELVVGAAVGSRWSLGKRGAALLLAFGGGALISSLSFDLFADAFEKAGVAPSGIGMLAGATAFVAIDSRVESRPVHRAGGGAGLGLLVGALLDGVPENLALGTTLAEGSGSVALLVAIFVSNFPEGAGGAEEMRAAGEGAGAIMRSWVTVAVAVALAVPLGYAALSGASDTVLATVLGFAGGAVLATLFMSVIPDAHGDAKDHPYTMLAAVAGFVLSVSLGTL
jgi:ZIP family zinc transporter